MRLVFLLLLSMSVFCIPGFAEDVRKVDPYTTVQDAEKVAYQAYTDEVNAAERRVNARKNPTTRQKQLRGKPAFMSDELWFQRLDEDETLKLRKDRRAKYEIALQRLRTYLASEFPSANNTPVYTKFLFKRGVFEFYAGHLSDAESTYLACINNPGSKDAVWKDEPLRDVAGEGLAEVKHELDRIEFMNLVETLRWAASDPETASEARQKLMAFIDSHPSYGIWLREDSNDGFESGDLLRDDAVAERKRSEAARASLEQAEKRFQGGEKP